MPYSILRLNQALSPLLPRAEQPFDIIGRLIPTYDGHGWQLSEQLLSIPYQKTYPVEAFDPAQYLNSPTRAAFVAMLGEECVGSIRVSARWNRNAFIEDIAVNRAHRGRGIGTALMDAATLWGRENALHGACLETQDNNLLACRFYLKYGFKLGSIDTMLYDAFPQTRGEKALFFYLLP